MLYLRAFGGLVLERDGETLNGAASQRRRVALLAFLAASGGRAVSRDKLLAHFWPESTAARGRAALNQSLYALRSALDTQDLILGVSDLRLNPDAIRSDAGAFLDALARGNLADAAVLYVGPFLDGIHLGTDLQELGAWTDEQRRRFADRFAECLDSLGREADGAKDLARAVEWRRKLASADPLSSTFALALMQSLVAAGDHSAALEHARAYENLVDVELNVLPDSRVSALAAALRDGSFRKVLAPPRVPRSDASPDDIPATGAVAAPVPDLPSDGRAVAAPHLAAAPSLRRVSLSYVVLGVVTIAALLSAIGVRKRHGHLNAGGAIVVVRGAGNRLLPAATSERVEAGVLAAVADSRLLEVHLHGVSVPEDPSELARRAGVRYGIVVTVTNSSSGRSNLGDSTFVHGDLVDADSGTVVASTEMISLASATADDARKLRSSVRAMLARRLDRRFATWAYASNAPRTYDAVLELGDGIDAFVQGDVGAAQRHFRASASLDTLSATPLVWSAFASTKYANRAAADSTAHELRASVRQLRPFDVAMLDYVDHAFGGDLVAILQSSQLLADVVPASEWRFLVASNAISLLRTHEAIRVLRDIGPNRGWMRKWFGYWGLLTTALHLQGDYAEELRVAEEARRDLPDDRRMLQLEVRALAALGRDRDVEQRCAEAVRYRQRPDWVEEQPMLQAVWELVAHGHRDAALRLLNREERAYREAPDSARSALAGPLGDLRLALGRGREARALLEPLLRQGRPTVWDLGDVAVAAALMGDQRAADSIATIISREYGQSEDGIAGFQFAQIAAARGDRTQAINLLRAAFRSGFRFPTAVHLSGFGLFWNDPALRAVMRAPDDDR